MLGIIVTGAYYDWPVWLHIILAFVVPISFLAFSFGPVAQWWMRWAYLRVPDVKELEYLSHVSGFGAYSPHSMNEGDKQQIIAERFRTYQFCDDPDVTGFCEVRNKPPLRAISVIGPIVMMGLIFTTIADKPFVPEMMILFVPLIIVSGYNFIIHSDRTPKIVFSNEHIDAAGSITRWEDITDYTITSGKNPNMRYYGAGFEHTVSLKRLGLSKPHLNHLMYVYLNRNRNKLK